MDTWMKPYIWYLADGLVPSFLQDYQEGQDYQEERELVHLGG